MHRSEPMRLEFYKQAYAPRYFDILMNKDGSLLVLNVRAMRGDRLTVALEHGDEVTPSPMQVVAIYAMLSRYRWCDVQLYGLDV